MLVKLIIHFSTFFKTAQTYKTELQVQYRKSKNINFELQLHNSFPVIPKEKCVEHFIFDIDIKKYTL